MKKKGNNMKLHTLLLLLSVLVFSQCRFDSDGTKGKQSIETNFKRGKDLDPKEWNCQKIENNTICILSNWRFIDQNKVFYFTFLNNEDKNTFFTIVKFDTNVNNLNADQYLQEGYSQMLQDTIETLTGYTLKKMTFKDKTSYYAEYFTKIQGKEYFAYSMVFEKNGLLYDIALKLSKEESPKYKETFKDILFNFRVDDEFIFDEHDEMEKVDVIDLSSAGSVWRKKSG